MLGLIKGLTQSYDEIMDEGPEEEYGIPVFYDDDEMYDHILDEE